MLLRLQDSIKSIGTHKISSEVEFDRAQEEEPEVDEDGDKDNDIGEDNIEISEEDPDDANERKALEE